MLYAAGAGGDGPACRGPERAGRWPIGLCISPATVRTHVENAMQKLEARTRVHAIAIALRQGLLKIPDSPY